MQNRIKIEGMNAYSAAALNAFLLGIAEAHASVTTSQDEHNEIYEVGRELGCVLLGLNSTAEWGW